MGDKTTTRMKIFLIGYMGCGKSSLGRRLAKRAGMRFVDMDSEIEQCEGASISDIFRFEGRIISAAGARADRKPCRRG